ncbi:MAG: EI24 domain-containing protein [Flavitalea sp.]
MFREIIIALRSYSKAHQFIKEHNLWRWIIVPGIIYTLLFLAGMYYFWTSTDEAVSWFTKTIGLDQWLSAQKSEILNFLFLMAGIMLKLVMGFFYFSLFKYIFLILGSPVFAYLSEKAEAILEGKDFPFNFRQFFKDIIRGIKLAFRNTLWQAMFAIALLILSIIPLVGWIVPVIALSIECYFYGFSMLDYSCERHKLSPTESIAFIKNHKGLAVGNGMIFYLMHFLPFVGWILAPAYAVIAATISLHEMKKVDGSFSIAR